MSSIVAMIEQGEGKSLEFKQALPAGEKLAKSIIAFANMFGGKIVIGVDDHRNIIGLPDAEIPATMDSIANIVHDSIQPVLAPNVYPQAVGDKNGYHHRCSC